MNNSENKINTVFLLWIKLVREELCRFEMYRDFMHTEFSKARINDASQKFLEDTFMPIENASLFLIVHSHFEKSLNLLCFSLQGQVENLKKLNDFNGFGIGRAKDFLSQDQLKIKPVFSKPEWQTLTQISFVRNVIAHCGGEIDESQQKHLSAKHFAEKNGAKITELDDVACIELTANYLNMSFEKYRDFLAVLENELQHHTV
ncbi:hypothetical protein [Agarivorans gilvus]|uniref:MAE-28990/MAE-18760-like HEPN domain-containing protein n=1 Tax=Agarivorans gilvus TaxID=680279 RepID=A0ABQ1I1U4_9ALTE|nr:hypothetical protein [Agarivorans gilvus]GGB04767.1 hypothetical protein GCM10007414_17560 [Agarivorans gilvus]